MNESNLPTVLLAILARNKEHALPLYLSCIDKLDFPKNKIYLYVHTNNNSDGTAKILQNWLEKRKPTFAGWTFIDKDEEALLDDTTKAHQWNRNRKRIEILAKIRQQSLRKTLELGCNFYFTADCDNFILPHTLKDVTSLMKSDPTKGIVAPLLHCIGEPDFSNFFTNKRHLYDWSASKEVKDLIQTKKLGTFEVPIVHCTYCVSANVIEKLSYNPDSQVLSDKKISTEPYDESLDVGAQPIEEQWEYVALCESATKSNIKLFVDNRNYYGVFLHFWADAESEKFLLRKHGSKIREILTVMEKKEKFEELSKLLQYFLELHCSTKGILKK